MDQKQPFHKVQSSNLSGFNPSIPKRPDNRALGSREARFVVGASAKNPVAVFVWCHRVIKKKNARTHKSAGVARQLQHEPPAPSPGLKAGVSC
jgi:hypothetical protein